MKDLVIVGAGAFGREVCWLVEQINDVCPTWNLLGFLDDNLNALCNFPNYPAVLGKIEDYASLESPLACCAIGNPKSRRNVVQRLESQDARWATLIHPGASVGKNAVLGEGSIVCRGSLVSVDVRLGRHVHLNYFSSVGHDVQAGDFCTLAGHVDLCGGVRLEEGVFLGSHASMLPKTRAGAWARIGAGSIVVRDVPAGKTVCGVPAKQLPSS